MGCSYPYLLRASRRDHARSRRDALLILGPARGRDARSRDGFKLSGSISGAHRVNPCPQKLYRGFLMSSMNVTSKPQGCGRFTIRRSSSTRVICSRTASEALSENKYSNAHEK